MHRNFVVKLDMVTGHPMVTSGKISNHSAGNQEVYSNPIEMYIPKYNNAFILYLSTHILYVSCILGRFCDGWQNIFGHH